VRHGKPHRLTISGPPHTLEKRESAKEEGRGRDAENVPRLSTSGLPNSLERTKEDERGQTKTTSYCRTLGFSHKTRESERGSEGKDKSLRPSTAELTGSLDSKSKRDRRRKKQRVNGKAS
jgi:hypothetical protein